MEMSRALRRANNSGEGSIKVNSYLFLFGVAAMGREKEIESGDTLEGEGPIKGRRREEQRLG